jgi:hypothetical protein
MRTLLLLTLALVATAHADTIISTGLLDVNPDIYEFPLLALCTVANVSSKLVTVNSVRLLHEDGTEYVQRDFPSNCSYPNPTLPASPASISSASSSCPRRVTSGVRSTSGRGVPSP